MSVVIYFRDAQQLARFMTYFAILLASPLPRTIISGISRRGGQGRRMLGRREDIEAAALLPLYTFIQLKYNTGRMASPRRTPARLRAPINMM